MRQYQALNLEIIKNISKNECVQRQIIIYFQISKYPFLLPEKFWFISTDHWVDILDRNWLTLGIKKDNLGKILQTEPVPSDWWLFIWSRILFLSCHRLIVIVWVRLGKCLIKTKTFLSMFLHKKCAQWILNMPNTACHGTTSSSLGSCSSWLTQSPILSSAWWHI